ncbi:MAG: carboxylating nicotinate-nucleotide diphosphorylase [Planctomycetia bacterium]|nr:carboxylating nicotinate-nucleotide diphosphorylase [Planctomycetia bacterium]
MKKDFMLYKRWNEDLAFAVARLLVPALEEDVAAPGDLTSLSLIAAEAKGQTAVVARRPGVICGLNAAAEIVRLSHKDLVWSPCCEDGQYIEAGDQVAELSGTVRDILGLERIILNFIGRMSGIASKTNEYVKMVEGTSARIYDTRKTLPGWRILDKYSVAKGGGHNHRLGLFDHILIKDNHLASSGEAGITPGNAVLKARNYLLTSGLYEEDQFPLIEIEVDTLDQLSDVLPANPDIVLLDNMGPDLLKKAVQMRDASNASSELEASGGINEKTILAIAQSGIERISIGALTHSVICFDVGLDWL